MQRAPRQPGRSAPGPDEAGALPTGPVDAGTSPDSAAPSSDDGADAAPSTSGDCPGGERLCNGACVANADPAHGCGDPACAPCPGEHAAFGCQGATCAVTACDPGYANCNALPADGCEADLSRPATCGASCTPCVAPANATATCDGVACGYACTAGFADCDGKPENGCEVPLLTDSANCGKCGHGCVLLTRCTGGSCTLLGL